MTAVAGGELAEAKALRDKITDPAARKLVDWYLYRGGYGTAAEIRAFLDGQSGLARPRPAHPARRGGAVQQRCQPARDQGVLRRRPARYRRRHGRAGVRLAADKDEASGQGAGAPRPGPSYDIPASLEPAFLKRVGSLLTEADHKRRLDRLLLQRQPLDRRAQRARRRHPPRHRRCCPSDEKKKAEARLAVFLRAKNSEPAALQAAAARAKTDWGLAVQRAQALRRQKKDEEAWKILLAEPESTMHVKPDGWWEERRANAYAALKAGKPKMAYELVRNPGPLSVNAAKDAAFLAGWLALRHLNDAKLALGHFEALAKAADGPLSHARGQYWLGRTLRGARRQGQGAGALQGGFRLLRHLPRPAGAPEARPAAPARSRSRRRRRPRAEESRPLQRLRCGAGRRASRARPGSTSRLARAFLNHLRNYLKSEAEVAMLAHLAEALGDTQTAVRIGKTRHRARA